MDKIAQVTTSPLSRTRLWIESAVLAFGPPAVIWGISRFIVWRIPAATHGSPNERFFWWIAAPALEEWSFVFAIWWLLRRRGSSFRELGVWRTGTVASWAIALGITAISIASNLRFFPRMHIPIYYAFSPRGFHLFTALLVGVTAGFCEEVLYRAFLMTEFARAGYGRTAQVLVPALVFGLTHAGYLMNVGFLPWLGIMLPTALVGAIWGISYLVGKHSLVPAMVGHFLNDATALHWIGYFMITGKI